MNPLTEIPFGGRVSRENDNRNRLHEALKATDCILDYGAVEGRPGSRLVTPTAIGSSGDSVQGLWRYRPDRGSARTVVVTGGGVNVVADPSSELLSDGTAQGLGVPFSGTAQVSGVQLDTDFYLGTDQDATPAQRIVWTSPDTYALDSLALYPQGTQPTATVNVGPFAWTPFSDLATPVMSGCVVQTNANTGWGSMPSTWRGFSKTDNGNDDPDSGAYARYRLNATVDASGMDWLLVAISPNTNGGTNNNGEVAIQLAIETGGAPGVFQTVGVIHDTSQTGGSPCYVFCDLRTLDSATRSAVRYIKLLLDQAVGGKFMVYGYCFLPAKLLGATQTYYVDFYNCSTGEFSALTKGLDVTPGQASVSSFPDAYMNYGAAASSGGNDDPFSASMQAMRCFNASGGSDTVAAPAISDIGAIVTISGTTSAYGATALTVRLWKDTENDRRLANATSTVALTCPDTNAVAQSSAYSLVDPGGDGVLSNRLYRPGGTLPRCYALAAKDQRLIAAYQNRVYISSYVPTSDNTHPFPQFPDIATEDADGWSFDIAPAKDEQVVGLDGYGDALYILTNKAVYQMSDLRPNAFPYKVLQKGCVSRRGYVYAEDRLFWCAWDGLYMAANRVSPVELSLPIKRLWKEIFLPDCHTVIGYELPTRTLHIFRDTLELRYSFQAPEGQEWTGPHTHPVNVQHVASWIDPV